MKEGKYVSSKNVTKIEQSVLFFKIGVGKKCWGAIVFWNLIF